MTVVHYNPSSTKVQRYRGTELQTYFATFYTTRAKLLTLPDLVPKKLTLQAAIVDLGPVCSSIVLATTLERHIAHRAISPFLPKIGPHCLSTSNCLSLSGHSSPLSLRAAQNRSKPWTCLGRGGNMTETRMQLEDCEYW